MASISSRLWFVLLVGLLHGVLGQISKVNTSAEAETGFIGWYIGPATTQLLTDPLTWTTSGTYAAGCSSGKPCTFATDCATGSITYDNGRISACNECRTMTIFQSYPFATPTASNIFCAANWLAFTVYRELPATATSTTATSKSTTSTTSPATTSFTSMISTSVISTTPTSTISTPSMSPSPTPTPSSSKSQAWIAGAVVGSVAAVAIAAVLIWWLNNRQKRQSKNSPNQERQELFTNYAENGPEPRKWDQPSVPMELQGQTFIHELDGRPGEVR